MIWGIASFCKVITEGEEIQFCIDQIANIEHTSRSRSATMVRRRVMDLLKLDRNCQKNNIIDVIRTTNDGAFI